MRDRFSSSGYVDLEHFRGWVRTSTRTQPRWPAVRVLKKYIEIGGEDIDTIYTYLGILVTLRPPALGGEQEKGKQYFENAIKMSSGKNLSTKVEYARGYARPLYDRKLHDRLLNDVVSANPRVLGYTLTNVLAQREAKELLSSADDYF